MWPSYHTPRELVNYHEERIRKYDSPVAMTFLARILLNGMQGVPRDPDRALQLLHRASARDHFEASLHLALLYASGTQTVEPDYRRAADILESIIAYYKHQPQLLNSVRAMFKLSSLLEQGGHGLRRDRPRAYQLLERALYNCRNYADAGSTRRDGMLRMAKMLTSNVNGFPYDIHRGVRMYKRAISSGAPRSVCYELALLYLNGARGLAQDLHQAVKYFKRGERIRSLAEAKSRMAKYVFYGTPDIPADPAKAIQLYQFAIDTENSVEAMLELAEILQDEDGGFADMPRAVQLLERVIELENDHEVMFDLGYIFFYGAESVPKDQQKGVELFKRSVAHGNNPRAMHHLGLVFDHGAGPIKPDKAKAIEMYEQAIEVDNHLISMQKLAFLFENDENSTAEDMNKVLGLYERAMQASDDAFTLWAFGCFLERGANGVPPDKNRADQLFERALQAHEEELTFILLFLCHSSGKACRPLNIDRLVALCDCFLAICDDTFQMSQIGELLARRSSEIGYVTMGVTLLEEAIAREEAQAMVSLANMLLDGEHITEDAGRAAALYEKAIDVANNVDALLQLGILLAEGHGVPLDGVRAKALLKRAIKAGNIHATYELAYQYHQGKGIRRNNKKAVKLVEAFLDVRGDDIEALRLHADILWAGGDGVDVDRDRAMELYEKVIEMGQHPGAVNELGLVPGSEPG